MSIHSKMYVIRHKNSEEVISTFPGRAKRYSMYGYIILTHNLKILFFFEIDGFIYYEEITDEYEIQIQNTKN